MQGRMWFLGILDEILSQEKIPLPLLETFLGIRWLPIGSGCGTEAGPEQQSPRDEESGGCLALFGDVYLVQEKHGLGKESGSVPGLMWLEMQS